MTLRTASSSNAPRRSFQLTGETAARNAVCGWVRRHMLQPGGVLDTCLRPFRAVYAHIESTFISAPRPAWTRRTGSSMRPQRRLRDLPTVSREIQSVPARPRDDLMIVQAVVRPETANYPRPTCPSERGLLCC